MAEEAPSSMLSRFGSATSEALTRLEACGVVSPLPSIWTGEEAIPSALTPALLVVLAASEEVVDEAVAGRRTFNLGGRVV